MRIPYGKGHLSLVLPGAAVIETGVKAAVQDENLVEMAMSRPIGSPKLAELAKGMEKVVIIISDHTRPVPSREIIPLMLREVREGNPDAHITLLVATGCHRSSSKAELVNKLGEQIVASERIVVHDAFAPEANVTIGSLPGGGSLSMNRMAAEADLLLAEGFIEPHFFAGFSGGRKSVLPGISDARTVLNNHSGHLIDHPNARTGVLKDNPIHTDMLAAAKIAGLKYIVNVVLDHNKRIAAAFAGDAEKAHLQGAEFLRQQCLVKAKPADIIITGNGGEPLDQNLYQCVKSLTAAEACAKPGAVIILCAGLADGVGGDYFYRVIKECGNFADLYWQFQHTAADQTMMEQWEIQILLRILLKHLIIVVTRTEMQDIIRDMKMEYAQSVEEALMKARAIKGDTAAVTVIPDGVSVIIEHGN